MTIHHRGSNGSISSEEIEYAVRWCLKRLIGYQMLSKLEIHIKHVDFALVRAKAELIAYFDDCKPPREFDLNLSKKLGKQGILRGIMHECVHIKQYVKNQLWDWSLEDPAMARQVRWKMRTIKEKDFTYRELPWEKEAFRMERNLYTAYKRHLEKEQITF